MELTAEMVKSIIGESEWTKIDFTAKIMQQNILNEKLLFAINQNNYTDFEYYISEGANVFANNNLALRQVMMSECIHMYRYARDNFFNHLVDTHREQMIEFGLTHSTIHGNQQIFTTIVEDFGLSQEKKNYYALIGCKNPHLIEMTMFLIDNGAEYQLIIDNARPEVKEEIIRRKELMDMHDRLEAQLPQKHTTRRIKI